MFCVRDMHRGQEQVHCLHIHTLSRSELFNLPVNIGKTGASAQQYKATTLPVLHISTWLLCVVVVRGCCTWLLYVVVVRGCCVGDSPYKLLTEIRDSTNKYNRCSNNGERKLFSMFKKYNYHNL